MDQEYLWCLSVFVLVIFQTSVDAQVSTTVAAPAATVTAATVTAGAVQYITNNVSQGRGTDHCAKCGTHLPTNVTKEEATTCFLTYGGLAGSGKPEDTVFECACKAEYNGTGSDGITCNDRNECELSEDWCDNNAVCDNTVGGFTCTCLDGLYTNDTGKSCYEINECSEELDLKPCGHNKENGTFGTCTDQKGTYTCDCNQGYKEANQARQTDRKWGDFVGNVAEGPTCENINECNVTEPKCSFAKGICHDTVGSFYCTCTKGYTLNDDESACEDIKECADDALNNCGNNTQCVERDGTYSCACNTGYKFVTGSNNTKCEDINECTATEPHYQHNCTALRSECNNTVGGFDCLCNSGYSLNKTTDTCQDDNECLMDNKCDANATCSNTNGNYSCSCDTGYTGDGYKGKCLNINECENVQSTNCDDNAQCIDNYGSYSCHCIVGFTGNGTSCQAMGESLQDLKDASKEYNLRTQKVLHYQAQVEKERLEYEYRILDRLCAQKKLKEQRNKSVMKREILSSPDLLSSITVDQTSFLTLQNGIAAMKLKIHKLKEECDITLDYNPENP